MYPKQFVVSLILSLVFLTIIIKMIQTGRLGISYSWLWLGIGLVAPLMVLKYDWFLQFANFLGIVTPTTALFLFSILTLFLMNLQLSVVISSQRRQIKQLAQQMTLQMNEK